MRKTLGLLLLLVGLAGISMANPPPGGAGDRSGLGCFRARYPYKRFVGAPFGPETIDQVLHSIEQFFTDAPSIVPTLRSDMSLPPIFCKWSDAGAKFFRNSPRCLHLIASA
jgi:hypothetical protein